jgi:hypothetical protein
MELPMKSDDLAEFHAARRQRRKPARKGWWTKL